jgi:hypothetical protein
MGAAMFTGPDLQEAERVATATRVPLAVAAL